MIFSICISVSHIYHRFYVHLVSLVSDIFAEMLDINHAKRCVSILNAFDTSYIDTDQLKMKTKKIPLLLKRCNWHDLFQPHRRWTNIVWEWISKRWTEKKIQLLCWSVINQEVHKKYTNCVWNALTRNFSISRMYD